MAIRAEGISVVQYKKPYCTLPRPSDVFLLRAFSLAWTVSTILCSGSAFVLGILANIVPQEALRELLWNTRDISDSSGRHVRANSYRISASPVSSEKRNTSYLLGKCQSSGMHYYIMKACDRNSDWE